MRGPENARSEFDVVVLGSGASGLAAAVTAGVKGLSVVVLEKEAVFGGTTAISGGGMWLPGNPIAFEFGEKDTIDARTYFDACLGQDRDRARIDEFLKRAPEMVAFFRDNTELQFFAAEGRPDYHAETPGAAQSGRTVFPLPYDGRELGKNVTRLRPPLRELTFLGMMFKSGSDIQHFMRVFKSPRSFFYVLRRMVRHFRDKVSHGRGLDLSNGNALVARLAKSGFDHGVEIRTSTVADRLLWEGNRVAGVAVQSETGTTEIRARCGVVLATGGFPHDPERTTKLYPHLRSGGEHWSVAPKSNVGDGARLAESAGAVVAPSGSHSAVWAPVSLVPYGNGSKGVFPHFIDRQKPGFIMVTKSGRRFMNEAESYHEFGRCLIAACQGQAETSCFLVADHPTIRRFGLGFVKPTPIPLFPYLRSGYLLKGSTLGELARRMGVDEATFVQTVEAYNEGARRGEDAEFGRGTRAWNRYNGDPDHSPNPCVGPIDNGPFYAVKIMMGDLGTLAGIVTDEKCRVLDANSQPVGGLFAVGNDMSSIMNGHYLGGGSTLGPAMTFGFVAACEISESCAAPTDVSDRQRVSPN